MTAFAVFWISIFTALCYTVQTLFHHLCRNGRTSRSIPDEVPEYQRSNLPYRTNIPTIPTLQKLCDAFGITLADFFLDEPDALQLTEGQQEIITLYNNLSLEKKKILKAYMKGLLMEV